MLLDVRCSLPVLEKSFSCSQIDQALLAAASAVASLIADHFRNRGGSFWRSAAADVSVSSISHNCISINIPKPGVALHFFGGVVSPKNARLLAIPQNSARGKSPLSFFNLVYQPVSKNHPHLKAIFLPGFSKPASKSFKHLPKGRIINAPIPGSLPLFFLVDKSLHSPDPSVLPHMDDLQAVASNAALSALAFSGN